MVARVPAKLYSMSLSHPSQAARLMLERKGIDHRVVDLLPGFHPLQVHAAGFRGGTVPALKLDGRRIQGSLRISRALEQARPDPPLFPAGRRAAVEDAEVWGERELQPVPRRLFRWAALHDAALRRWLAGEVLRLPAPGLAAAGYGPVARLFARMAGASDTQVQADLAELPGKLDRVDELIAAGTIGGPRAERRGLPDRHDGKGADGLRGSARSGRGPAGRRPRDAGHARLSRTDPTRSADLNARTICATATKHRETRMSNRTFVIGVGMTKFEKPGSRDWDYPTWPRRRARRRSRTPASPTTTIEQAFVGYCYGESTSGQRAVYGLGLTGIPVVNVNNNCSTGSSALYMARQAVRGGLADCALALGLREDGEGLARREVHRPHEPDRQAPDDDVRGARARGVAVRAADVRQRGPRAHGALRLRARPLRVDRLEEPQALGQQPVRAVPGRVLARGHQGGEDDPRPADQAAVLADLRRLGAARSSPASASSTSTTCGTRRSRSSARRWSPTCPPRSRSAARSRSSATTCRRRRPTAPTRRPEVGAGGRRRGRAARLLLRQRADHLRGARAWPRRARATSWSTPRTRPTAGAGW